MNRPEGEVGSFLTLSKLRAEILETLQASGVEDAETSARWIVAEATGLSPESLVEDAETALTQGAVARADAMCQRRALGEHVIRTSPAPPRISASTTALARSSSAESSTPDEITDEEVDKASKAVCRLSALIPGSVSGGGPRCVCKSARLLIGTYVTRSAAGSCW